MSHSIEYYQRMDTEQLIYEMNHAHWMVDRQRAESVYQDRIKEQKHRDQTYGSHQVAALNNRVSTLQNTLNNLTHQNTNLANIIQQQNDKLRVIQQTHNQQVAEMRDDYNARIEDVYNKNRDALQNLEAQMVNENAKLRETIDRNFQRTTAMINTVSNNLTGRIDAVRNDLSAQIQAQQTQINTLEVAFQRLHHNEIELRGSAQEYLDAAVALINSTIEYNNENFHNWRNDELNTLINIRMHVESDLDGPLSVGNARSKARELFEGALRYRANVYADEQEWQLRHAAAQQCIDAAFNDLAISRTIDADDKEIDVDYWTCGDLKRISGKLENLETLLKNPNLTKDELTGIGELAEIYRQEVRTAVNFAMQAVQCSLDRKDLLQNAIEHIQIAMGGLDPIWQEYFAGDKRLGYRVYLTNTATGERVVLTAEPLKDGTDLRNQFRFDILSMGHHVHNAAHAAAITHALAQALSMEPGCEFSSPNCTNQTAPAVDNGQSDCFIWRQPNQRAQDTAREQATPAHAPHVPHPTPATTESFIPQALI